MKARIPRSRRAFESLERQFLEASDDGGLESLVPAVKARGHLTRPELLAVCRWKSPRALPLAERNEDLHVREATTWALGAETERLRIEALLLLQGVSWPTASVILHFFHSDPYPVLDIRALWSLGFKVPASYTFDLWWKYVEACRELSTSLSIPMRTVDRALWQYSRNRGGPA